MLVGGEGLVTKSAGYVTGYIQIVMIVNSRQRILKIRDLFKTLIAINLRHHQESKLLDRRNDSVLLCIVTYRLLVVLQSKVLRILCRFYKPVNLIQSLK